MIILLSPAKSLDFTLEDSGLTPSTPLFADYAADIAAHLAKLSESQLAKLMAISPKLAKLNVERFRDFAISPQKAAILAYDGDVYKHLKAKDFSQKDLAFAQQHCLIISGLYGLLRPLDLIVPYRLEMSTKLKLPNQQDLYSLWQPLLADYLQKTGEVIINLASEEYSKAITCPMITIEFKEYRKDKWQVIGILAKKARGAMANQIIRKQINRYELLKDLIVNGYAFNPALSMDKHYVYTIG